MGTREAFACEHCGAEADMTLEGFERVSDVIQREKKVVCKACGKETSLVARAKETFSCKSCGAEADMTLDGFENVEDVIKREKKLICQHCGKEVSWTNQEDLKAIRVAMEAEKNAYQAYARAAKMTKNPKGKEMFQQLSEFEVNHYTKLKDLLKSLQEKGEWILYAGTSLKKKKIPLKAATPPKGQEQLTDMDALKIGIREEKKAEAYYRSMAELAKDPRGKDMYKRLAEEESLHEKILNDQYYSLHNTGVWSWGD
jgi:rubrerythrin/DNA-directed RNA polymerase subunit RPC12/RpoP